MEIVVKILLDTNAVLYYLADNLISNISADFVISFITEIELLAYPNLSKNEENIIKTFLNLVEIVDINNSIKKLTIDLRKSFHLKIPDAIICATALYLKIPLVTNDRQILKIKDCPTMTYEMFKERYTI